MTWLLNRLQRIFRALTHRNHSPSASDATKLGGEIASRLQQSQGSDPDAPVAVRVKGSVIAEPSAAQSTASFRQKKSSVFKDTVDPVAQEPDTHRRLDAAPAARPGGTTVPPRFPTNVSDLISDQSTFAEPSLKDESASVEASTAPSSVPLNSSEDEQLPEIHDLLPAIEPDQPADSDSTLIPADGGLPTQIEADLAQDTNSLEENESEELPADSTTTATDNAVVEPAQRVSADEQAMLFSFDITETDIGGIDTATEEIQPTINAFQSHAVDSASTQSEAEPIAQPAQDNPLVAPSPLRKSPLEESEPAAPADSASTDLSQTDASTVTDNPWLSAVPKANKPVGEQPLMKVGTVKLLFKLKPGNFHGYISPEDGSKDILFHQKYINADIFEHLDRGTQVVVAAIHREGKMYATRVDLLQE